MNTIEPDYIAEKRLLVQKLRDEYKLDAENAETLRQLELEKTNWFLSVLERDSISNEEERRIQIWRELDLFGYTYIGKIRVQRILFKLLYWLKLIRI